MSFIEIVRRARDLLREEGRITLRGLKREFDLDDDALEALVDELVDGQQVAGRDGKVVVWLGAAQAATSDAWSASEVPTAPATEGDRRQLTVMFCDLAGSSALSEQLDPEDTRNVIRAYQEVAAAAIERYGGYLAKYIGDGILAYFGYPEAHDEDAERGVRAALEILQQHPALNARLESILAATREHRIRTRIGIHTGLVVTGPMGAGETREERAIVGDTPNIAARLESVADPDSVVISEATLRLIPGMFETVDLGTPTLKGITEPIHAFTVLRSTGVRSRLDMDPSKLTPLVGRDQELGLLVERWEQVGEGEGQVVLVSGEAGLGKSRLLQAFRERLAETPHGWLECRCSPYTEGSAFHPMVQLLEHQMDFQDGDEPETRLARLEAGIAAAGLSVSDVVPLLAPLLSLPLPDRYPPLPFGPELQRKKTIEALVAWIFGLAESQPQVLLVEDLHWCDPSTVELLGWLLEQSPTAKVLTLLSFRPHFESPWPARSHVTPLTVKRLSRRQAANLIGGMTRDVPLPDAVVKRLVARADGVPLFAEELTKMVLESDLVEQREGRYELTGPITELAIPATLQDSLMARLDRLDEGKPVAQLGAALGREFLYELLRSVSLDEEPRLQAGLAQLVDAELVYQRGALPQAGFTFKHALIQETAYHSLLRSVRQQFHGRIAQVLEDQFPERVRSEPEVVARHYDEAGLGEPAIAHYQRAGAHALQRSAYTEAIRHLQRGLDLLITLPDSHDRRQRELALQIALGPALIATQGYAVPEVAQTYARARELCQASDDVSQLFPSLYGLWMFCFMGETLTAARELGEQLLSLAEQQDDAFLLLSAYRALGYTLCNVGDFPTARTHLEQGIDLYDSSHHHTYIAHYGATDPGVSCRSMLAIALWPHGYPDTALERADAAVSLSGKLAHPFSEAFARGIMALIHQHRGEVSAAHEHAEATITLATTHGFPSWMALGTMIRGWALTMQGQKEAGIAELREGLAGWHATGTLLSQPKYLGMLADACFRNGQVEEALQLVDEAISLADKRGEDYYKAELYRLLGEMSLRREDVKSETENAEGYFHQALAIARSQHARSWELRAAASLARLWQRQGKVIEARDLLRPVYDWFTEGFDTQDLKDAKTLLTQLE